MHLIFFSGVFVVFQSGLWTPLEMLPSSCSQEDARAASQGRVENEATVRPCRVILNPWDVSLSYRNGMVNLDSLGRGIRVSH